MRHDHPYFAAGRAILSLGNEAEEIMHLVASVFADKGVKADDARVEMICEAGHRFSDVLREALEQMTDLAQHLRAEDGGSAS